MFSVMYINKVGLGWFVFVSNEMGVVVIEICVNGFFNGFRSS